MKIHKNILNQIAIAVCAFPFFLSTASGEVWRSQELNCELSLPSGGDWSQVAPAAPAMKVAMRNLTEAKAVSLLVVDAPPDAQTLAKFLPGFIKGLSKPGTSTDISEGLIIDGRAACCYGQTIFVNGTKLRVVNTIVLDNGKVYIIEASSRSTNPVDDPELSTTLRSFHFISDGSTSPLKSAMQASLNRLPHLIGTLTFCVLVGIAAVGLIIKATLRPKANS